MKTNLMVNAERIALVLVAGVALATMISFLQGIAWPVDIFAHFRWQYCLLAVPLTLFLAARNRLRPAVVAGLLVAINGIPVADVHFGSEGGALAAGRPATRVDVVSLNLWYQNPQHETVQRYIQRSNADLVLLTEVTEKWRGALSKLSSDYPHQVYAPDSRPHNGVFLGLMVLSKIPVVGSKAHLHGPSGHVFAAGTAVRRFERALVICRGSPDETAYQARQVKQLIRLMTAAKRPVVVAGDFNLTPFSLAFRDFL